MSGFQWGARPSREGFMKVHQDIWLSPDKKTVHIGDGAPNGSTLLANGGGETTIEAMQVRAPDIAEEKLRAAVRERDEEPEGKALKGPPENKARTGPASTK